jgi:hypothetical protein
MQLPPRKIVRFVIVVEKRLDAGQDLHWARRRFDSDCAGIAHCRNLEVGWGMQSALERFGCWRGADTAGCADCTVVRLGCDGVVAAHRRSNGVGRRRAEQTRMGPAEQGISSTAAVSQCAANGSGELGLQSRVVKPLLRALSYLFLTSFAPVAEGQTARIEAATWPLVCEPVPSTTEHHARRVFALGSSTIDPGCHQLALAEGLLRYDPSLAATLVANVAGPLQQTRELRWLKGRIALAAGQASVAFAALRPDVDGWPMQRYVIWDLAVAATIVQQDSVATEAYRRLIQMVPGDERTLIAVHLEQAALESRLGGEGLATARTILSQIAWTDTDPDSCPWVSVMLALLDRLEQTPRSSARFPCSRPSSWSRLLDSSEGSAAAFAEVPRADGWLRLARNERLALLALGLVDRQDRLRRRLWTAVEARENTPLFELRRHELSLLTKAR